MYLERIIMLTGKQRSYLRGLAQKESPSVQIGKNGITENVVNEVDTLLLHRELVKVNIQESADLDTKETANILAEKLDAEFVQAIGRKFTLYRRAKEDPQIVLPR